MFPTNGLSMSLTNAKRGVLLTNLGTPQAPVPAAVRRYLREFLSDARVVEFKPRWLWKLLLNAVILPGRAKRSAALYAKIWQPEGSPLWLNTDALAKALQVVLGKDYVVAVGMRYGQPSIAKALQQLHAVQVEKITILPLYPQYSATTTATTFDAVAKVFGSCRELPELRFINQYYDHPAYIEALAASVQAYWSAHGQPDLLLISFHGLPQAYVDQGDPYQQQCIATAKLLAKTLGLADQAWQWSFQSRFGPKQWLQPYTDQVLAGLPQKGINKVQVICPGFAVDCLETLEEIAVTGKSIFLKAGGQHFGYIPCLNDREDHVRLSSLLVRAC